MGDVEGMVEACWAVYTTPFLPSITRDTGVAQKVLTCGAYTIVQLLRGENHLIDHSEYRRTLQSM